MELGKFQYDHTPILTVYSDYIDIWHSRGTHEELLSGKLDETITSMFSEDALLWAVSLVKNYTKDPENYVRRTELYKFFHQQLKYEKHSVKATSYGKIDCSSTELIASDPYVFFESGDEASPFARKIKEGDYELKLYSNSKGECLLVQLIFENEVPTDFEIAPTLFDQEHHTGSYTLAVFSGILFFCGPKDLPSYSEFFKREDVQLKIKNTPDNSAIPFEDSLQGIIPVKIKKNIYTSFWGLNKKGRAICLILDLQE